ncbi:YaaC family protein [endosymbiont of unidentified scaly snail isolate Monju]|uniref:YaaC family protein n=1 Tax=endosymbiont of unidentified scaly snail isolate Monju TaxID=1248727 RepID=UPI001E5A5212|nr:YaaC family protein [endosymbiont of unidentified scaly snail isolate Monju]
MHSALIGADFRKPRVLCTDPWEFVSLWLKRDHQTDAAFYWAQAHHFYDASLSLPVLSSPLTSYYCFLNTTKALLTAKKVEFKEVHGVGGRSVGSVKSLDNEIVDFQGGGILPALCKYLEEPDNAGKEFTLKDIFWQLPFIHRSFCLTYRGSTELFIPLVNQCFLRRDGSKEAWFHAEIDKRYINSHTKRVIQPGFELFDNNGVYEIRRKRRFKWSGRDIENSIEQFSRYHKQIRRRIFPIYSSENRWYLKKSVNGHDKLNNSQLVLIFAAMHRLSELSRYDPIPFSKHFNVNHNWLLSEFIKASLGQFVYGMASEITGLEFIKPDAF